MAIEAYIQAFLIPFFRRSNLTIARLHKDVRGNRVAERKNIDDHFGVNYETGRSEEKLLDASQRRYDSLPVQ